MSRLAAFALFALATTSAFAGNRHVRINEVMAGLNAHSGVQFVELAVRDEGQKQWGPRGAETTGRCELIFTDGAGVQTGRYVFPHDPPIGAATVLVATAEFAFFTGVTSDFIMPRLVMPLAGKVTFRNNADNAAAEPVSVSLSYGGAAFTGDTGGAGVANPAVLAIMNSQSLRRVAGFGATSFGSAGQNNADFALGTPTPAATQAAGAVVDNAAGQVALPAAASAIKQGENLFLRETFLGNGRSCGTCHVPSQRFGLEPIRLAQRPADDPLFVSEKGLFTLTLSDKAQPSDFAAGSVIRGSHGGTGRVLAGSEGTYKVIGNVGLQTPEHEDDESDNIITDAKGNRGTLVSLMNNQLGGPTPTNTDPFGLERMDLLRSGRALILENINGFTQNSFMRSSPSLMNVKFTAPFGLSGEEPDLRAFSANAVTQHATRSMHRIAGVDFRSPTAAELDAMVAFQNSLVTSASEDFDEANQFQRFLTTPAAIRGRDLFFGPDLKCAVCHNGKTLSQSDGRFGTTAGVNQSFNTGVQTQAVNNTLPTEQNIGALPNSRAFSTQPLIGIGGTAPFFHESSANSITRAIQFYASAQFAASPASTQIGGIPAVLVNGNLSDLIAFLTALGEEPGPRINGTSTVQQQMGSAATWQPFTAITIFNDSAPAATLTVSVSLDDAGKGVITPTGGFAITAPGEWTFTGTAADATAAIRGLVFKRAANRIPHSLTEVTRFTIGVNNGVAATLFNDNTAALTAEPPTPSLSDIPAFTTLNIGPSNPVPFTLAGVDTAAADFTLTATSSDGSSVQLGGAGTTRTLTLTPTPGTSGVVTVTFTATAGGQSTTRTVEVTIVPFTAAMSTPGTITFPTQPGHTYYIEKTADLGTPAWTVESTIIATGTSTTAPLTPEPSGRMFYRVRTEQ